jgi:hypothetical protein
MLPNLKVKTGWGTDYPPQAKKMIHIKIMDMKALERSKLLVVCLIIGQLFHSCSFNKVPYEEADARLTQCVQNWRFFELTDTVVVTVVLFKKNRPQTGKINPAFIVGFTKNGDTIGAVDKRFELEFKRGEKVKLTGSVWPIDKVENMHNYPVYRVYQKEEEITAICNVQKVFNATFNSIE